MTKWEHTFAISWNEVMVMQADGWELAAVAHEGGRRFYMKRPAGDHLGPETDPLTLEEVLHRIDDDWPKSDIKASVRLLAAALRGEGR